MSTHRRVKSKDEEFGKRDDDFRPQTPSFTPGNVAHLWRWRKRRIFAVVLGVILLVLVLRNISFDTGDDTLSLPLRPGRILHGSGNSKEPKRAPPRTDVVVDEENRKHYYDGRIRFFRLAPSLHGISSTMGIRPSNRNILFAASSLRSVANLMPLACRMGRWERNYVHLAVFGRDPMPLDEILEINGVDLEECNIFFHDARSDYSEFSTDERAAVSVTGAMKHINDFMHPQAIIMDDGNAEDSFFTRAMRNKASDLKRPLIELPSGRYEDFMWMTKLDSGSIASWYRPTIDILIHAPPQSSGGLLRLTRSLLEADYAGLKPPRVTIELPSDIEPFAARYLQFLEWPPNEDASPLKLNTLALHHRIPSSKIGSEEASLRFLESFYPTSTEDNHVLVLSSQVEVSPLYLQYLHYVILEYKYSAYGAVDADDLLGVSLDIPNALIDGKAGFEAPKIAQMDSKRYTGDESLDQFAPTSFLYGAPSSTASLIFGENWAVFHNFLKNRLAATQSGKSQKSEKSVTEAEPAWMEYLHELMRAKGWYMLHPASALVAVHNDLARVPEEFTRDTREENQDETTSKPVEDTVNEPFLTVLEPPTVPQRPERDPQDNLLPLHQLLPFDGDLPELPHLPYVDYLGNVMSLDAPKLSRMQYASHFRRYIGGCSGEEADRPRVVPLLTTDDLFCLPGMDLVFDEGSVNLDGEVAEAILEATDLPSVDAEPAATQSTSTEEAAKATAEP